MKTKIIVFVFSLLFVKCSYCQTAETDSISKAEVSKLAFLIGNWKGAGWMMGRDRQKTDFNQTENIQFKLDSTAILIEGTGKNNGRDVHNALAIVSYNKEDGNYSFQSYLQNGMKGNFVGELIDGKFYWYPFKNMRYIIEVNEEGQWYEIGEIKQDENWYPFFEMTLNRAD